MATALRPATLRVLRALTAPAGVVLGTDSLTGLSILRSLGANGVATIGVDPRRVTLGSLSRRCSASERCAGGEALLELLLALAAASPQRNVLFPESDDLVLFLDRHRGELGRRYALPIPAAADLARLVDKQTMTAMARAAGLSVPRTVACAGAPPEELRGWASFPAIVKPAHTQPVERCKALVVAGPAELAAAVGRERFREGCVVQELVAGDETNLWTCMGYSDAGARPVAMVTGHKIRQRPPDFGVGTLVVTRENRAVKDLTARFLGAIGYVGPFELEFKRRGADEYVFIEINPRVCALNSLAVAAGTDVALLAYREACGLGLPTQPPQRDDVAWVDAVQDFDTCVRSYRARRPGVLRDWAGRVRHAGAHAVFDRRDPAPFALNLAKYAAKSALRAVGLAPRGRR